MDLGTLFSQAFGYIFIWVPIVIPFIILRFLIKNYIGYAREKFISEQENVLLEIIPPEEVPKSPAAMELFLNTLYQTSGETTWINRFVEGKVRPWFSLEMVSIGGSVKFFIWGRKGFKRLIETQLYAQFPGIEVKEAEHDYSFLIDYVPEKTEVLCVEYALTAPDPYPIKTYVDYGLDMNPDEEFKIDPITPLIEFLGSLQYNHQVWIQIIVRAYKAETIFNKWKKPDTWKDEAKAEIEKIKKSRKDDSERGYGDLTKGDQLKIAALERSVSKQGFEVGIRGVYIAPKDEFDRSNIAGLAGGFKQFNSQDLNGFKPGIVTGFDFDWSDITGKKIIRWKKDLFDAYRDRAYFFREYLDLTGFFNFRGRKKGRKAFILNSEELATIFHFPGKVLEAPTFSRILAKKAPPPSNLPH